MTKFQNLLDDIQACPQAREWVADRSLVDAWKTCERPDWLLFFADKSGAISKKEWRLLACAFARTALKYTTDPQPLKTIEVAERFARGEASVEELDTAMSAAYSAAYSAASSVASNAARSAAYSAAMSAAYSAASSAAWAALESAAHAARRGQCEIIRGRLSIHTIYAGYKNQHPSLFPKGTP